MKKESFILLLILSIQLQSQSISYPIVDTNVSEFTNDITIMPEPVEGGDFYGQDASYMGNQPSYTNNGDGTITDNVTGLMWQQDMGKKISYEDAVAKLDSMNKESYTDWRIPSIKELYSLAFFSGRCMGDTVMVKFIDTTYFAQGIGDESIERQIDAQTWSSTYYVGLTMTGDTTIFGYNFVDGRLKGYPKYDPSDMSPNTMYFRMVRGNELYGMNDFTDNADGTISDNATGLMWQQADNGNTYDWQEGLEYAENLTLAGHSDWRMPNAKELHSIVDYTRSPSTTSSPAIDPLFSCTEITDPDGNAGQYGYYWTSSPLKDGTNPYTSAVYICFGKAQGEMSSILMDVHGAGAQRNDPKSGTATDYPAYFGPQGDVQYVYNFVRCVRDINSSTAVNNTSTEENIKIYPIPSANFINITTEEIYHIQITDLSGKILIDTQNKSDNSLIDISHLSSGLYLVNLSNSERILNRKIIKE